MTTTATVLSLAGIEPPEHFQGTAFLGAYEAQPSSHLFGFSGRMDERYDLVRSVRDERWLYVRNFMPHRPHGQHVAYLFQTPTTQVWHRMWEAGELAPEQSEFWEEKATEELYDLAADPDQVHNLAASPDHRQVLDRLRSSLRRQLLATRDLGLLPEAEIYSRAEAVGATPYEYGHSAAYRLEEILEVAELASDRARGSADDLSRLHAGLLDEDSAIRAWSALGFLVRGRRGVRAGGLRLREALDDEAVAVRTHAAEALGRFGNDEERVLAVASLLADSSLHKRGLFDVVLALNALDAVGEAAKARRAEIAALPLEREGIAPRNAFYVERLVEKILSGLD